MPTTSPIQTLLPIMGVVLIAFLIVGMALPVLPLQVHQGLGLSTFVVGVVAGSQFAASLFSRVWAGRYADRQGAKRAVVTGLVAAAVAGFLYLLSLPFVASPWVSVSILLAGRALLGAAESFIITGAVSWGLSLAGPDKAGRVIAWMGMAMFAALALGAPIGTALFDGGGFLAIAVATIVAPLVAGLFVGRLAPIPAQAGKRAGFALVITLPQGHAHGEAVGRCLIGHDRPGATNLRDEFQSRWHRCDEARQDVRHFDDRSLF